MAHEEIGGVLGGPFHTMVPRETVSVSDVERLAKAGVAVKWEDIASQVVRDENFPKKPEPAHYDLKAPLIERLLMEHRVRGAQQHGIGNVDNPFIGTLGPASYHLWQATTYEGSSKVYVFAVFQNHPPLILEDESALYPSDALVTKIRLLEDQYRRATRAPLGQATTQAAPATPSARPKRPWPQGLIP